MTSRLSYLVSDCQQMLAKLVCIYISTDVGKTRMYYNYLRHQMYSETNRLTEKPLVGGRTLWSRVGRDKPLGVGTRGGLTQLWQLHQTTAIGHPCTSKQRSRFNTDKTPHAETPHAALWLRVWHLGGGQFNRLFKEFHHESCVVNPLTAIVSLKNQQ